MTTSFSFRKATEQDVDAILAIIHEAQGFLAAQGLDQWQDGYPGRDVLLEDIQNGNSYLLETAGQPLATAALLFGEDPTYTKIEDGAWLTPVGTSYAALHRVASASAARGTGATDALTEWLEALALENGAKSIRVDTHKQNQPMQKFLKKRGYKPTGTIHISGGAERIAFEKILLPHQL